MARRAFSITAGVCVVSGLPTGCSVSMEQAAPPTVPAQTPAGSPTTTEARGDGYYLGTCALCDRTLGAVGPAVETIHEQRSLRFCAEPCRDRFAADPASGLSRIDAVMIADQSPHYPIKTSIVSGRPLPDRFPEIVWGNRLVRLADPAERPSFLRDPERYVRSLDAEVIRVQRPAYGMLTRCPVQGDIFPSDVPIDFVVANRMIRACCGQCVRAVKARPYQYLAMVDYANREAAARLADPPADQPAD